MIVSRSMNVTSILTVEAVSKRFWMHRNRPATLKEAFIQRLNGVYFKADALWALRDVSFTVDRGRSLGIIGHNGAGKSTLLRLICGLGRPTMGNIKHIGQFGSLLELGSGFHLELTGRENLLTGGILSGLTKAQVKSKEDEIIGFAEMEEFIDQPVRTYSTGMYLRLAFAAAIHFDPDFLVIDEVLAVGDSRFQQKCFEKLTAFRTSGKSLIITSHDLDQIKRLCDEVLVLEEGRAVMQGDPENAFRCYQDVMTKRTERRAAQLSGTPDAPALTVEQGYRMGTQEVTISDVQLSNANGVPAPNLDNGDGFTVKLAYTTSKPISDMALSLGIYSATEVKCFETFVASLNATFGALSREGRFRCDFHRLPLLPGTYYVNVGIYPTDWSFVYDYHWQMHPFYVAKGEQTPSDASGFLSINPVWSSLP